LTGKRGKSKRKKKIARDFPPFVAHGRSAQGGKGVSKEATLIEKGGEEREKRK